MLPVRDKVTAEPARPEGAANKRKPIDPALLPWWHPWLLMRGLWNLVFSAGLGLGLGAIVGDVLPQILRAITRMERPAFEGFGFWVGVVFGVCTAYVSFMSYRMDDKTGE